jgi:cell division control protein 6
LPTVLIIGRGQGDKNQYSLAVDIDTILENLPKKSERLGGIAEVLLEQVS